MWMMTQQPRAGRSTNDRQVWLSMLIIAMEDASLPERRASPCARSALAGLRAQLACPVSSSPQGAVRFGRRN
jgi:hypothetical protein